MMQHDRTHATAQATRSSPKTSSRWSRLYQKVDVAISR